MEKQYDLLLVGGTIVTGEGMRRADVGCFQKRSTSGWRKPAL